MATAFQDSPLAWQDNPLAFQIDAGGAEPSPIPAKERQVLTGGIAGMPLAHELFYEAWERFQRKKLENEEDWIMGWAVSDDDP